MIDPDHARRVLEYQESQPVMVIARWLSGDHPPDHAIREAEDLIEALVAAGYTIVRLEDAENET